MDIINTFSDFREGPSAVPLVEGLSSEYCLGVCPRLNIPWRKSREIEEKSDVVIYVF